MIVEICNSMKEDLEFIQSSLTRLQEYLVPLDPEGLIKCPERFGEEYTVELLARIDEQNGQILIAKSDQRSVGLVAGVIEHSKSREGTKGLILELFVEEKFRSARIGSRLMTAIEQYFRVSGCVVAGVKVFVHNERALRFYERHGYGNRRPVMKVFYLEKPLQ